MAREGNWMETVGGRAFYPLDPRPEEIDIEDIAHALSMVCRFGGHVREHYSVAEHSYRVAEALRSAGHSLDVQLYGLLHDAAEAYLGDVVWPLKQAPGLEGYKQIEARVEAVIFKRFDVVTSPDGESIVKHFDLKMLATEKRDLMSPGAGREAGAAREAEAARDKLGGWHCDHVEPFPERIRPQSIVWSRQYFLRLFRMIESERGR